MKYFNDFRRDKPRMRWCLIYIKLKILIVDEKASSFLKNIEMGGIFLC